MGFCKLPCFLTGNIQLETLQLSVSLWKELGPLSADSLQRVNVFAQLHAPSLAIATKETALNACVSLMSTQGCAWTTPPESLPPKPTAGS